MFAKHSSRTLRQLLRPHTKQGSLIDLQGPTNLYMASVDSPLVEWGAGRRLAKADHEGAAGIAQHVVDLLCGVCEEGGCKCLIPLQQ